MSFHAVVGENHGVESERTDQTLRSPLNTFLAIFYILSGARKKILSATPHHFFSQRFRGTGSRCSLFHPEWGRPETERDTTELRPILIVPEKMALENTTCSLLFCSFSAPKKAPCGERAREERFVSGKFVKLSLVLLSRTQRRSPFFALFSRQKEEARSFLSSFAPQGALFLEKRKKEDSFFSFLRVLGAHKNRPEKLEGRTKFRVEIPTGLYH